MKTKLAIIVSHPIQHFSPQYASLAKHPDLQVKVFFASALGMKKYIDPDFKTEISWNNLLLDQYDHVFLNGETAIPSDKDLDAPSLDAALEEFNPDVMIIYGYFQQFQRRAWRWAKRKKVKLAYISDSERNQQRNPVKEIIKYPFIRWYFSPVSAFLSVGDANEAYYKHYGVPDNKLVRMHFSIDIGAYEKAYSRKEELASELKKKYNLQDSRILISTVGKLVPWKRQGDIIDALKLLEDRGIEMDLAMIGSGAMESAWKEKAKTLRRSRVFFTGFVSPEELPAYYAASNMYIHPASIEPHSLAISEAIYMGCPAIISDRCGSYGPTDDVQEGRSGFVFQCGNIPDLAKKIEQLALDENKRRLLGSYAHGLAVKFQQRSHAAFASELIGMLKRS